MTLLMHAVVFGDKLEAGSDRVVVLRPVMHVPAGTMAKT